MQMKLTGFRFFLGKKLTGFSKIINTYKTKNTFFNYLDSQKFVHVGKIVQLSYYLNKNILFMK